MGPLLLSLFFSLLNAGVAVAQCPDVCTADFTPVCGTDFTTYSNLCRLNVKKCQSKSSLRVLFDGECECRNDIACTEEYDPHCGTDGKTYSNWCNFGVARLCSTTGLELERTGECPQCPDVCTADFTPVCGTDFKTYSNLCNLNVKKCQSKPSLAVLFNGRCSCRDDIACTADYQPHCGTDGTTYGNRCSFAVAKFCSNATNGLEIAFVGECGATLDGVTQCPEVCGADYSPVCGSNFRTYDNQCNLDVEQCKSDSSLSKLFDGECVCRQDIVCPDHHQPLCGTDWKTYRNNCHFAAAKLCSTTGLDLASLGACGNSAGAVQPLAAMLIAATWIAVAINY